MPLSCVLLDVAASECDRAAAELASRFLEDDRLRPEVDGSRDRGCSLCGKRFCAADVDDVGFVELADADAAAFLVAAGRGLFLPS